MSWIWSVKHAEEDDFLDDDIFEDSVNEEDDWGVKASVVIELIIVKNKWDNVAFNDVGRMSLNVSFASSISAFLHFSYFSSVTYQRGSI